MALKSGTSGEECSLLHGVIKIAQFPSKRRSHINQKHCHPLSLLISCTWYEGNFICMRKFQRKLLSENCWESSNSAAVECELTSPISWSSAVSSESFWLRELSLLPFVAVIYIFLLPLPRTLWCNLCWFAHFDFLCIRALRGTIKCLKNSGAHITYGPYKPVGLSLIRPHKHLNNQLSCDICYLNLSTSVFISFWLSYFFKFRSC